MHDHRPADMIVPFGIGVLVGAGAALLMAPASGDETRRRLGQLGHDALDKAREGVASAREFARDQSHRVERAIHEGKEAYLKASSRS